MKYNGAEVTWFFYGAIVAVSILIAIFLYPEYKLYKKKLKRKQFHRLRAQQGVDVEQTNPWITLIKYLSIALGPLILFILGFILIYKKIISKIKEVEFFVTFPSWVWLLIILVILVGLVIYFRKFLLSKIPKPKTNWKWLWWIPLLIGLFFLGRWVYTEYVLKPKILKEYSDTITTPSYQRFDVRSANYVTAGQWYLLEGNEPLMSFVSQEGSELNYSIVMIGHETRNWTRKTGLDSDGELFDTPTGTPGGYDEAKIGSARIQFDKSGIVVVKK